MRLLLDTQVLLWWLMDDVKLSSGHRELIADAANQVFVSSVSIAEASIKASLGKLEAPSGMKDAVAKSGFELLSLEPEHAEELRTIPWQHKDPFDRMLIAQARVEGLIIVTVDKQIRTYDVEWR